MRLGGTKNLVKLLSGRKFGFRRRFHKREAILKHSVQVNCLSFIRPLNSHIRMGPTGPNLISHASQYSLFVYSTLARPITCSSLRNTNGSFRHKLHQRVSAINFLIHFVSLSRFSLRHFHFLAHMPVHHLNYSLLHISKNLMSKMRIGDYQCQM